MSFPVSFQGPQRSTPAPAVQIVTVTGQWQCPPGVTRVKLTLVGGGASSATLTAGGPSPGGYAGGTAVKWASLIPGAIYSVVIGAGGVGPGAGTNANPNPGGNSSFSGPGISITANGGTAVGGGAASGGDLNITGGQPTAGSPYSGGASMLSGNAPVNTAATGYGGAGGGASNGAAGNNGFQGVLVIEY